MKKTNILSLPQTIFSSKIFWILTTILILSLLLFYIFQIKSMFQKIYSIKDDQQKFQNLSQENRELALNFSQTNSLTHLETLVKSLSFEKTNKVEYIQMMENQLVVK